MPHRTAGLTRLAVLTAALIAPVLTAPLLSAPAHAGGFATREDPTLTAPAPAPRTPALVFKLRGGVQAEQEYFGSRSLSVGPDLGFSVEYARLPGGRSLGSLDGAASYGFAPRGSFRLIGKRSAADHPELAGLNDVPLAVELGLGLGYRQQNFEAFADLRYGVIGHHAFVAELGADLVMRPTDRLTLKLGPRLLAGDSDYARTYFGVTPVEASAALPAFAPKGGALTAGVQFGAAWQINRDWGIEGAVRYDRYLGDAKSSPIVRQGRDEALSLRIGLTRRLSLNF